MIDLFVKVICLHVTTRAATNAIFKLGVLLVFFNHSHAECMCVCVCMPQGHK